MLGYLTQDRQAGRLQIIPGLDGRIQIVDQKSQPEPDTGRQDEAQRQVKRRPQAGWDLVDNRLV
jgi:hypothetical protein